MPGKTRKRWTVLIYMVADDPKGGELLDQQAVQEMDQIIKAALSVDKTKLYVALQVDFRTLPGVWRRSIGESAFVRPESNASDPATLYGFFDWATAECPADHYLLIFWGHSRGQFGMFGDSDPFDYTAQTLTLDELRTALTAAKRSLQKPMDVIAFKDCFMANLEIAYELSGLADYLLASPGLVPVEGWPYEGMFNALTNGKTNVDALKAAQQMLKVLKEYYDDKGQKGTKGPHKEVPYSLLSTAGSVPVVDALKTFLDNKSTGVYSPEALLRPMLETAASVAGDPALADLGQLVRVAAAAAASAPAAAASAPAAKSRKPQKQMAAAGTPTQHLDTFIQALGNALSNRAGAMPSMSNGLVIDHTGVNDGGVNVFIFPESTKHQRDSMITRLANEKAYRSLAISKDTKWADIALGTMPIQQARSVQDMSKAIALFEQLERVGVGRAPRSAARANAYLRRRARLSRNKELTEADVTEAAQFAAIADIAMRLADFASDKGAADFDSDKGAADFDSDKGAADFGPG